MEPSLVTWPTSRMAIRCDFAAWISDAATSRTWVTLPADPSTSALLMVWTESTTTSSGSRVSIWPSTVARSVSLARYRERAIASIRSARVRTCAADSSPLT